MSQDEPADAYFTEIEAHFAARRGTPFLLSAKDWALMKSWHEDGIPLAIVLEAIDTAFDARERSGRKSPISSLSYCRHAVVDLWDQRRQQMIGDAESVPELDPQAYLRKLGVRLESLSEEHGGAIGNALLHAAEDLAILASKGRSAPSIEAGLIDIENEMIDSLLEAIPEKTKTDMMISIDAELERYEIADEETRLKTRDANLRRLLRKELRIPRLSLFG